MKIKKLMTILIICLSCNTVYGNSLVLYRNSMILVAINDNKIPIATFSVSCNEYKTPLGKHKISQKLRWHELFGNCFAQYNLRFGKHVLLHSVLYREKYNGLSLINKTYNGILDRDQSSGCVRLRVRDAKWLYDNIKIGDTIEVKDAEEEIERPTFERIDTSITFDPTDIETIEWEQEKQKEKENG